MVPSPGEMSVEKQMRRSSKMLTRLKAASVIASTVTAERSG